MGMLETRCGCCVALYCGALAEAGWRVSWWRVLVPACAGAIGGVSMGVRSSDITRGVTAHGWEAGIHISDSPHKRVAVADVHEAAGGGRSDADSVWVNAT